MHTPDEIRALAHTQFASLQLPPTWKLEGYDTCRLHADPASEITSIGAVYIDTGTRGIDTMRYRVFYHVPTERLGIVSKAIRDFGKYTYSCLVSNKTAKLLNEHIVSTFE